MKYAGQQWFCTGLSLCSVVLALTFQATVEAAPLKVMSFNIRGDFDLEKASDSSEAWNSLSDNHRRDLVAKTIQEFDPDLLGVQEAFHHQLVDLRAALHGYDVTGLGRDDGKQAGEHSAILFRTDRFRCVKEGSFWLSNSPNEPGSLFPGAGYVRIASWAILVDKHSDAKEFFVLNTHWDNVSEAARLHSAKLIRRQIKTLAGELPILVMGDLNDSEESAALTTLLGTNDAEGLQLHDSFRQVVPKRGKDEATFHDFTGKPAGSRIDFILYSDEFKATDAAIQHTNFDGRSPSDHFPVTATLELVE